MGGGLSQASLQTLFSFFPSAPAIFWEEWAELVQLTLSSPPQSRGQHSRTVTLLSDGKL